MEKLEGSSGEDGVFAIKLLNLPENSFSFLLVLIYWTDSLSEGMIAMNGYSLG